MTAVDIAQKWASPAAVLVVDGDTSFKQAFKRAALSLGLAVEEVDNVAQARKVAAYRDYRAVFVNIDLSDGSGLDLLPEMVLAKTPVVLMVPEQLDCRLLDQVLGYGPCAFMRKSMDFSAEHLESTLCLLNIRHTVCGAVQSKPGVRLCA